MQRETHRKYGNFQRISITLHQNPTALQRPHATPFEILGRIAVAEGLGIEASAWKVTSTYEPRLQHKVDVLVTQIRSRFDQPLSITQWTAHLASDIMGLADSSKDFRQLEDAAEHAALMDLLGQCC
ncbi:hypothetical protein BDW75DRAFT_244594 [Aspergillus navahoensis]